jgi:hypothetical protein
MATISFANDVMPIFYQYKSEMMWRFDLTNYDQVKANATLILGRISNAANPMPPPPYPPLTPAQIQTFQQWINGGCQP